MGISPGDNLIAVPPTLVTRVEGVREALISPMLRSCDFSVWVATDEIPIVPYGSVLVAMTRAAHVLFVTVDDPNSQVAQWLAQAEREVGTEIVERW